MVKKSIGAFIAVLRKSGGMTQRDLAEMLGVSDKTVSHWERDESAPDLTLIPVIAEIFGVTCDELLRGERIKDAPEEKTSVKAEKQIKHLLNLSRIRFRTRSMIALGLSVLGLLAALICNFAFNRAYLGFFIGCVFWASAAICEWIFCSYSFSAVGGDDFEGEELNAFKIYAVRLAGKILTAPAVMLAASLPFIIFPRDAFQGVTAGTWLLAGLIFAAAAAAVCFSVTYAVNNSLIRKGVYTLERDADILRHKTDRLKVRYAAVTAAVMLALLLGQYAFNAAVRPEAFSAGTSFDNCDDFVAYMETENPGEEAREEQAAKPIQLDIYKKSILEEQYFDQNGNPTTKEEALTEYIYDNSGSAVCKYVHLNQEVAMFTYSGAGTDEFSATAYTSGDIRAGEAAKDFINARWFAAYLIAAGIGFLVYFIKRAKLKKG